MSAWKLRLVSPAEAAKGLPPDDFPWPAGSLVIGAYNEKGEIVGRIGVMGIDHIEGTWVAEEYRGTALVHDLLSRILGLLELVGRDKVLTFIADDNPKLAVFAKRKGFSKVPVSVWVKGG